MYTSMTQIKRANAKAGFHWFEPGSMSFFRSQIFSGIYGGQYFITSEQFSDDTPRLYTIRQAFPDGSIDTVGEFQAYKTLLDAITVAKTLPEAQS